MTFGRRLDTRPSEEVAETHLSVLAYQFRRPADIVQRDLVALHHKFGQLAHEGLERQERGRGALDQECGTVRADAHLEQALQQLQIGVVGAEQHFGHVVRNGDARDGRGAGLALVFWHRWQRW